MENARSVLSVPKGEFYAKLVLLEKRINVSDVAREQLIRWRMRQIGKPELIKKWKNLVAKRRIFEKVFGGELRTKYSLDIPKTKKEIEQQIDEITRQIAEIIHSL